MSCTRLSWIVLIAAWSLGCGTTEQVATPTSASGEWEVLFDGSNVSGWRMAGSGMFELQADGSLLSRGGTGLFYYADRSFRDFELELEWKADLPSSNSGVFVRIPETDDPRTAAREGHEIQILEDADALSRTGAIPGTASSWRLASNPPGSWNRMRVQVAGQRYRVWVNDVQVNDFISDRGRGGFIGIENHGFDDEVWFRNIRARDLLPGEVATPLGLADYFALDAERQTIRVLVVPGDQGGAHHPATPTSIDVLQELSRTTEFDFEVQDSLGSIDDQSLESFDLILFNNNGPRESGSGAAHAVGDTLRRALVDFLAAGKGVVGVHAAIEAYPGWDEYRAMFGAGNRASRAWTQSVRLVVEEPDNPSVAHLGDDFWIRDEIYAFDQNPRWNGRILLSLDMPSVGIDPGPADFSPNDHPVAWVREYGGGRVFYTGLGHFPDTWTNPLFLEHLLQGMRIAAGRLEADFKGHRVKEVIAHGIWPDDIAVDERGNVWIAELRGRILYYDAERGETREVAHLQTTDPTNIEHGLYGIEVDPDFHHGSPYVYVYYAEPETFINTLSRFTYRGDALDLASEHVLLRVPTEPTCCHQAGDLEWGPDSTLYLSTGDTGMSTVRPEWRVSQERLDAFMERYELKDYDWVRLADSERSAQNLQDLRGKILRINRDGSIPRDNPFYGQAGVRWEIYAYGLRNPYRFKVDPATNDLYVAVVGPDGPTDYDEYNISQNGGENFGWPRTIGRLFMNEWTPDDIPNYVPPMWEYTYEAGGRSATMGPLYRDHGTTGFPPAFHDKLFIFDWSRRWIKYADVVDGVFTSDTAASVKAHPVQYEIPAKRLKNIKTFDMLWETNPISMEVGPDGSIYVAEFTGFWEAAPGSRVTRYRWVK